MSVLDPAGRQAAEIAWLWDVFHTVTIVVWSIVVAFVIAATITSRRKRRRSAGDPLVSDPRRDRRMLHAVVAAGGATVLTLVGLLVASVWTGSSLAALDDEPAALRVRVTGKQWWWRIEYEPANPHLAATTANELHLPVGQTIELELTSGDVIHSFWLPSLHGKKDLIPGRTNRTWIRIDEPGVYRGQCAEFCGLEHAKMAITVVAVPPDQFEAWLAHQRQPAAPPEDPVAQRGLAVFLGTPCATCHTISGTPAGGRLGPDLTHLASRSTLGAGSMVNTRAHLSGWIADPHRVKPGVLMPAIDLPAQDLAALLAYLEALQ